MLRAMTHEMTCPMPCHVTLRVLGDSLVSEFVRPPFEVVEGSLVSFAEAGFISTVTAAVGLAAAVALALASSSVDLASARACRWNFVAMGLMRPTPRPPRVRSPGVVVPNRASLKP